MERSLFRRQNIYANNHDKNWPRTNSVLAIKNKSLRKHIKIILGFHPAQPVADSMNVNVHLLKCENIKHSWATQKTCWRKNSRISAMLTPIPVLMFHAMPMHKCAIWNSRCSFSLWNLQLQLNTNTLTFGPTPGSLTSSSNVFGMSPAYFSQRILAVSWMCFALVRKKLAGWINFSSSAGSAWAMFSGVRPNTLSFWHAAYVTAVVCGFVDF